MTDLLALAERVEALQGPDRAIGREVLLACGRGFVSPLYRHLDPTASIDAAMSLVPEDRTWQIRYDPRQSGAVTMYRDGFDQHHTIAQTPAAALTAAALRARASTTPENPSHQESDREDPKPDQYKWQGEGPEPASWFAPDGTKVYRSYEDYCDD